MAEPTKSKPKLNRETFDRIAGALGRLEDIKQMSALSQTKEVEAEALGLVEFLSKELIDYAPDLLGCWFVIKSEYEPLCNTFLPLINRANSIIAQRVAQQGAARADAAKSATPESNILALK